MEMSVIFQMCDRFVTVSSTLNVLTHGTSSFEQNGRSHCKRRREETERKETEQKETEEKETKRKAGRKEAERKEAERKETDRKETERKETELGFLRAELREVNIKLAKAVAQAESAQQEKVKALSLCL